MVAQADEACFAAAAALLQEGRSLTLGVAHRELLVDGEPFPAAGAAGRELAGRLYRRGVAALTIDAGLTLDELRTALAWLARERDTSPPPVVPGLLIVPLSFDRLALLQRGSDVQREVRRLWHDLARVALEDAMLDAAQRPTRGDAAPADAGEGADEGADHRPDNRPDAAGTGPEHASVDGAEAKVANAEHAGTEGTGEPASVEGGDAPPARDLSPEALVTELDRLIAHDRRRAGHAGYVLQRLALDLRDAPDELRVPVAERLRHVLLHLQATSLGAIFEELEPARARHQFITTIADVLPATAVIEWLERAAALTGQAISHHLLRVLGKLATLADARETPTRTTDTFRDAARAIVDEWTLADPNPRGHDALLAQLSGERTAPARERSVGTLRFPLDETASPQAEALRLVQLACELDVAGEDARAAAERLVERGEHRQLFEVLSEAPGTQAATTLSALAISPASLRRVLLAEPFDAAEARALLAHATPTHAPAMLEALAEASQRSARRLLLDGLKGFGPALLPLLVEQLAVPDAPWFFVRNVLALLRELLADAPADAPERLRAPQYLAFLEHPQAQVRLESLRLLLDLPSSRGVALLRALDDRSARVVAAAIDALLAAAATPDQARSLRAETAVLAERLGRLVDEQRGDPDMLARAVRAMGIDGAPRTRDWLLAHVSRRTRLLRRLRLAESRPTVIAALQLLAERFATAPPVAPVLALARKEAPHDLRRAAVERAGSAPLSAATARAGRTGTNPSLGATR
jgi:hypothetical protein